MKLIAWIVALSALAPPAPAAPNPEARLAELAAAVLDADYRGDRPALARLEAELGRLDVPTRAEYREYWRGFALWRRGINGFNETPRPDDLVADIEKAVARFKAAQQARPEWIEAKLAMVGCQGNLIYLAGNDEARRKAIVEEAIPGFHWILENAGDNPRALWIRGGMEMWAPPPRGGDVVKAVATMRQGVAAAWRESLAEPAPPSWVPRWGGPENLMNLSYVYAHGPKPDRALALAYAEGALTAVPEWHYVRDVLLPQIEALPVDVAAR